MPRRANHTSEAPEPTAAALHLRHPATTHRNLTADRGPPPWIPVRPITHKGAPTMTTIATASASPPGRRRCTWPARIRRSGHTAAPRPDKEASLPPPQMGRIAPRKHRTAGRNPKGDTA
ncbi:hypothetical protein GCM10010403_24080 [Glycomyces rutgersensis]|uniref:Uncharacterized protein n=1 Tax=Glycomyces rutgersensis TaxID=58115 RepID=A0ABP5SHX4_9ACTN